MQEESSVVLIKLINDTDIIAELIAIDESVGTLKLQYPLEIDTIHDRESNTTYSCLKEYNEYSDETSMVINVRNVIYLSSPKEKIEKLYNSTVRKLKTQSVIEESDGSNNEIEVLKAMVERKMSSTLLN